MTLSAEGSLTGVALGFLWAESAGNADVISNTSNIKEKQAANLGHAGLVDPAA